MDLRKRLIDPTNLGWLEFHHFGERGPKVLITAGLHGGEATGVHTARRIIDFLKGEEAAGRLLDGRFVVLPVGNPTAFRRLQRTSPYDELDLNRIFPGDRDGTVSQRVAASIWEEAEDASFVIDLHCCGTYGRSYTLALHEEHETARELARKLSVPVVIESGGTRGQLFVEASHRGIPAVIIELTGGGPVGEVSVPASNEAFEALVGLFRAEGLVAGPRNEPRPVFHGKLEGIRCPKDGFLEPRIAPGERAMRGQTVAALNGEPLKSPFHGTAIQVRPPSLVFAGQPAVVLAPLAEPPPRRA